MFFVRFFFDVAEIGGVFLFVFEADFMRDKLNGLAFKIREFRVSVLQEKGLLDVGQFVDFLSASYGVGDFNHGKFAHAINTQIRFGIDQYAGFQTVVPIVVMCHPSQRGLDAAYYYRCVGIKLL